MCRFGCGFYIIGKQSPSDLPADFDIVRFDFPCVNGVACANIVEISAGVSGVGLNGVESATVGAGAGLNGVEGADDGSGGVFPGAKRPTGDFGGAIFQGV